MKNLAQILNFLQLLWCLCIRATPTCTCARIASSLPDMPPSHLSATVQPYVSPSIAHDHNATSNRGKRGIAYNDGNLLGLYAQSIEISWGYNWDSREEGLPAEVEFVPMLWGVSPEYTRNWTSNVELAILRNTTRVMAFNEPDDVQQSNLSPLEAARAYQEFMQPLSAKHILLGSPAVTNAGGAAGLSWLEDFLLACTHCQVDFVCIHWYDQCNNTAYFKRHLENTKKVSKGKPVLVSEFKCQGSSNETVQFLSDVMGWMDKQDFIAGYAYFMLAENELVSNGSLNGVGRTYGWSSS